MRALDTMRTRLPEPVKQSLSQLYAMIPLRWRMGKDYWQLKLFLQEAQWWELERIRAWQIHKLKEMVRYAYVNVPGYYALYRSAGVTPDDITALDDIRQLPFTTKELLRDNLREFTTRDTTAHRLAYVTTGGSTGIPFGFYHTEVNRWMENAFIHSGWEWAGWKLGETSAILRGAFIGSPHRFWQGYPVANELALSSYYLSEEIYPKYVEIIESHQPSHLQAYPSVATILADIILDHHDEGRLDFQIILLGSENLYDWQKEKIHQAFPKARLFSWYGHAEQTTMGSWCEKTEYLHVWPFYGWTEVLDEAGYEVEPGQAGEIVGTSFWNFGTPFIRYRTMDQARKLCWGCTACRRQFLVLEHIDGRLQEMIVTRTGRLISMTAINMHSDIFDHVRQFQFYQDTLGKVVFKVARKPAYDEQDTVKIYQELKRKLGNDTELAIVFVEEILRSQSGKFRFLEQKLPLRYSD